MPILTNPRHERFAQALASGKTADEAYQEAGYNQNNGNAVRLKGNEKVASRVAELLEVGAKRTEITIESLTKMHLQDRTDARDAKQYSAATAALTQIAKLNGLVVDRSEVNHSYVVEMPPDTDTVAEWQKAHAPGQTVQ